MLFIRTTLLNAPKSLPFAIRNSYNPTERSVRPRTLSRYGLLPAHYESVQTAYARLDYPWGSGVSPLLLGVFRSCSRSRTRFGMRMLFLRRRSFRCYYLVY